MTIFRQIKNENEPMKLSTKAQNLDILKKTWFTKSKIPNFYRCSVEEWIVNKIKILKSYQINLIKNNY